MKQLLSIILLSLMTLCSWAQDKRVYTEHDPAFDYISKYMPSYYYENHELEKEPGNFSLDRLDVDVRVMHNLKDEKTFTYLIIHTNTEHVTLFTEEIPSLVSYLEHTIELMETKKVKDTNYYIYNSLKGLFLKTERKKQPYNWPYYDLEIQFLKIEKVKLSGKAEIRHFIHKLKSAGQYFPPQETDFRIDDDNEKSNKWEMKEVQEQELKTA